MSPDDSMSSGEIGRRLTELAVKADSLAEKIDSKFDTLDTKFLSLNEYRANQETALELRRSLADDVTSKVAEVAQRVTTLEMRAKARAGVIASALVAVIVALVAAGLTKGFGL